MASWMSLSQTTMSRLCASIFTSPKNWNPALGGRVACPVGGAFCNTTVGPNVLPSGLGPKVPALSGPATNSQNLKSLNCAFAGS